MLFERALGPAFALALSAALPFATAGILRVILLRKLPAAPGEERSRRLWPFRNAAMVIGLLQLQLCYWLGSRALGAVTVDLGVGPLWTEAFAALCAAIAFVCGGLARRFEEPQQDRATRAGTVAVRLRMMTYLAGPLVLSALAGQLPVVSESPVAHVSVPWLAAAILLCGLGVAYGGIAVGLLTRAVVPAPPEWRSMAQRAAEREGVRLALALRFPTPGSNFANAAAVPWARTMVITDRIAALLTPDELDAVLAHEAGHLSEGPRVAAARVGSATLALAAIAVLPRVNDEVWHGGIWLTVGIVAAALSLALLVRPLARRMEERADARAKETTGSAALATALRKLHEHMQYPAVTGARRVHPDLFDRLAALGADPGPRPDPPNNRAGSRAALALLLALFFLAFVPAYNVSAIDAGDTLRGETGRALFALAVNPRRADAWVARARDELSAGRPERAANLARIAARLGPHPGGYYAFWAEFFARAGQCDAARAMDARAEAAGGLPASRAKRVPTLEARCGVVAPES